MMDLPLALVAKATGRAEAGAHRAAAAIAHGKHIAMINQETAVSVGPILKHRVDRAGVVYSAVDGEQHGLLIGPVDSARTLGVRVIAGGKAGDRDHIFDPAGRTVTRAGGGSRLTSMANRSPRSHRSKRTRRPSRSPPGAAPCSTSPALAAGTWWTLPRSSRIRQTAPTTTNRSTVRRRAPAWRRSFCTARRTWTPPTPAMSSGTTDLLRISMRRFTRLTTAISRRLEKPCAMLASFFHASNWIEPHGAVRRVATTPLHRRWCLASRTDRQPTSSSST